MVLISLRYDGTDRRTHLKVTGTGLYAAEEPVPADEIRISPDGKWVLAHVMNQLYLLALPAVGGDAPTINVNSPAVPLKKLTDIGADYFAWADDVFLFASEARALLALLLWIAVQLLLPEDEGHGGKEGAGNLASAIKTILLADLVMSLDNVIAVAASIFGILVPAINFLMDPDASRMITTLLL